VPHRSTPTIRSAPPTSGACENSSVETCHTDLSAHTSMSVSTLIHNAPALRCCAPSELQHLSTGNLMHGRPMATIFEVPRASAKGGAA
jgi:hypothetical protein